MYACGADAYGLCLVMEDMAAFPTSRASAKSGLAHLYLYIFCNVQIKSEIKWLVVLCYHNY